MSGPYYWDGPHSFTLDPLVVADAALNYVAARAAFDADSFTTDPGPRRAMDLAWLELVDACTEDE